MGAAAADCANTFQRMEPNWGRWRESPTPAPCVHGAIMVFVASGYPERRVPYCVISTKSLKTGKGEGKETRKKARKHQR